jgi:hypothetical protein
VLNLYLENVSKKEKNTQDEFVQNIISTLSSRNLEEGPDAATTSQNEKVSNSSKYLANLETIVGATDYKTALEHVKFMKTFHDLMPYKEPIIKALGIVTIII